MTDKQNRLATQEKLMGDKIDLTTITTALQEINKTNKTKKFANKDIIIDFSKKDSVKTENLDLVNSKEFQEIVKKLFSKENLKKHYPSKTYDIKELNDVLSVINKKTGVPELEIHSDINNTLRVLKFDNDVVAEKLNLSKGYTTLSSVLSENFKQKPVNHITQQIHEDITAKNRYGLPTTGKDINKHIADINSKNVMKVYTEYSKIGDENLLSAISNEVGLDTEVRIKLLKHVTDKMLEYYEKRGVYVDDLKDKIKEELSHQKNSWTKMSADVLRQHVNTLITRGNVKMNYKPIACYTPNGKIDNDFSQGRTGDCWLLASIKAIANNPKALKELNECLSVDKNGNVKVYLKGPNKTYTITKEELQGSLELSSGDLDVRAIEIAVSKYFREEYSHTLDPFDKDNIDGNQMNTAYEILLGKGKSHTGGYGYLYDRFIRDEDDVIKKAKKGNHIITVATQNAPKDSARDSNGNDVKIHPQHAYAVVGADDKYVYIVNPWDTGTIIQLTHDKFKEAFESFDMVEA